MDTLLTESICNFSSGLLQELRGIPPRRYAAGDIRIPRRSRISLCGPRVDDSRRDVSKMRNIASRQAGVICQDNTGDHRIAQLYNSPSLLSQTGELRRQSSCLLIEGCDSMVDAIQQVL